MSAAFIGCKISLISKSEIRYEGILYTIDTKESTIALAKVKSYGTEDRPTDKPVGPRNETYEYIIFRASDIKDLIVDDPPASGPGGLSDPAIIQAQSGGAATSIPASTLATTTTSSSTAAPSKPTVASVLSGSSASNTGIGGASIQLRGPTPVNQSRSPTDDGKRQDKSSGGQHRNDRVFQRDAQYNNNRGRRDNNQGQPQPRGPRPQYGQQPQYGHQARPQYGHQERPQYGHQERPQYGHQERPQYGHQERSQYGLQQSQRGGRGQGQRPSQSGPQQQAPRNFFNNTQRQGGQRGGGPRPPKTDVAKLGDYDFEKANLEFTELETKFNELGVEEVGDAGESNAVVEDKTDAEPIYDKTKSFFDAISCEAIERNKGNHHRIDRRQEKKLNEETFGVGGIRYRGRGYGRGYGRGGYGGRGGYQNRGGFNRNRAAADRTFGNGNTESRQPQSVEN